MSNLTNRLNSLWSMLEEEGYYTKANTAMLARNRIEELEAKLAKATDTLSRIVRGDDDAHNWAIWTLGELKGDKKP